MHVTLAHGCPAWRARRRRSTSPANAPSQSMRCGQPTTARHHAACAPWQPPYKAGDRARRAATRTTMRARAGRGPSGAPPLAVLGGARLALMVDMRGWRPAGGDAHQQDTRGSRGKAQRQGGPAQISMTFRPSPDAHHALGRRAWPAQRWSTGPTGALPPASSARWGPTEICHLPAKGSSSTCQGALACESHRPPRGPEHWPQRWLRGRASPPSPIQKTPCPHRPSPPLYSSGDAHTAHARSRGTQQGYGA